MSTDLLIDAATLTGRQQAFAVVATHAAAARAQCLREIHRSRAYEALGLTWEQFCTQRAGISRFHADRLIQRLDEFGESYFKLTEIINVSVQTYRRLAPHIHDDAIEIGKDTFPLVPENASRIRAAIRHLFYRIEKAEARSHHSIAELCTRLDAVLQEVTRRTHRTMPLDELAALRGLATSAIREWRKLSKTLNAIQPL